MKMSETNADIECSQIATRAELRECERIMREETRVFLAECDWASEYWDSEYSDENPCWDGINMEIADYIEAGNLEGEVKILRDPSLPPEWATVDASEVGSIDILLGIGTAADFELEGKPSNHRVDDVNDIYPVPNIMQRGPYIVMQITWEAI